MAELTESAYESKFNDLVTGLLKDNTNKEIVPLRHRTQVTDTKDSFLNIKTRYGSYIRQIEAFGTNSYTATTTLSPSTALSTGAVYLIFFENSSTAAASVTLNGFTRKLYINPSTQADNGDLVSEIPYLFVVDETLDSGNGGLLMVTGGASGSTEDFVQSVVDTTGTDVNLDFENTLKGSFTGSVTFAAPRTINYLNQDRAIEFDFMFEVTDVSIPIDFGADSRSPDARFVDGVFTPEDVGLYKVKGTRYGPGGLWLLDFNGVYSVGDAPPEPPDPGDSWVIGSGIWNDTAVWKDTGIWNDNP